MRQGILFGVLLLGCAGESFDGSRRDEHDARRPAPSSTVQAAPPASASVAPPRRAPDVVPPRMPDAATDSGHGAVSEADAGTAAATPDAAPDGGQARADSGSVAPPPDAAPWVPEAPKYRCGDSRADSVGAGICPIGQVCISPVNDPTAFLCLICGAPPPQPVGGYCDNYCENQPNPRCRKPFAACGWITDLETGAQCPQCNGVIFCGPGY